MNAHEEGCTAKLPWSPSATHSLQHLQEGGMRSMGLCRLLENSRGGLLPSHNSKRCAVYDIYIPH